MLLDISVLFLIILCAIISIIRGFIKELGAIIFFSLSIVAAFNYYDFFTINYSKYIDSDTAIYILSTMSVFIILNIVFMVVNNWIMYILSPVRLGLTDRISGISLGVFKGMMYSCVLFFTIQLYCHIAYNKPHDELYAEEAEEMLPIWVINSYSYQILFSNVEDIINTHTPKSFILKMKEVGGKINGEH